VALVAAVRAWHTIAFDADVTEPKGIVVGELVAVVVVPSQLFPEFTLATVKVSVGVTVSVSVEPVLYMKPTVVESNGTEQAVSL
jgi:hypothetical protein